MTKQLNFDISWSYCYLKYHLLTIFLWSHELENPSRWSKIKDRNKNPKSKFQSIKFIFDGLYFGIVFLPCNPSYLLLAPNRTSCPLSCKFFGGIPCKGHEAHLLISREKSLNLILAVKKF